MRILAICILVLATALTVDVISRSRNIGGSNAKGDARELFGKLLFKFPDKKSRLKDPDAMINDFDSLLQRTSFRAILDCRKDLPEHRSYRLVFMDPTLPPQNMNVSENEVLIGGSMQRTLDLNFSLRSPMGFAFFTYIHELQHVCQFKARPSSSRWTELNTRADSQRWFLQEIEAMLVMMKAYSEVALGNPSILSAEAGKQLKDTYEGGLEQVRDGQFAQQVVSDYLDYYKPKTSHLFEVLSERSEYPTNFQNGRPRSRFELLKFNSEFKEKVLGLGLEVIEH